MFKPKLTTDQANVSGRTHSIVAAFIAAFFLISAASLGQAIDEKLEDTQIASAIEMALITHPMVPEHKLDVEVTNGIAKLSGTLEHLLAEQRAIKVTRTVKGVKSVIDQVEVEPVARPDKEILMDVEQALLKNPATEAYEITTTVNRGIVTLRDTVDSWQEREHCARVASAVRGVRQVNNELVVSPQANRPAYEIKQDVEQALAADVWIDNGLIDVDVTGATVTLRGTVGSAAEKARSIATAHVAGVEEVNADDLKVEWWAYDAMRRQHKFAIVSDSTIRASVQQAYLYDARVPSFQIDVAVDNGVVTLTGVVDNLQAKQAAEDDARNTTGVWRVRNLVKVRPLAPLADERINKQIHAALQRHPEVDRLDIRVLVFNGDVRLYGHVDNFYEKQLVESIAARQHGVVDIDSHLEVVSSWVYKRDWEIRENIKEELFWNPFIDNSDIKVTVEDGIAYLNGTVNTVHEREQARQEALDGGAKRVHNKLDVRYGPDNPSSS